VIGNLGLILVNRSWSSTLRASLRTPNGALWRVIGGTLVFLACVLYVPGLRDVFGFTYLHASDVLLAFAASAMGVAWFELLKWAKGRRARDARA